MQQVSKLEPVPAETYAVGAFIKEFTVFCVFDADTQQPRQRSQMSTYIIRQRQSSIGSSARQNNVDALAV